MVEQITLPALKKAEPLGKIESGNNDTTSMMDVVRAYALVRQILTKSSIQSTEVTIAFQNIQNLFNGKEGANHLLSSILTSIANEIADKVKSLTNQETVSGVLTTIAIGAAMLFAIAASGGMAAGILATIAAGAGAGGGVFMMMNGYQQVQIAGLKAKFANASLMSDVSTAVVSNIQNNNKSSSQNLASLLQSQASMSADLNKMVSGMGQAIQTISQRARAGIKSY